MKTSVPKAGGHRKPAAAQRHAPEGYEHMKQCPACKGTGTVPSDEASSLRSMMVRKA